ncbi:hypothetical protein ACEPAI_9099 [Sanghuangporus weigelae]
MAPYFIRNLIPRKEKNEDEHELTLLQALATLTPVQILQVFCGWFAWTCDAIDFFSVSLSVTDLEELFNRSTHDITTSITLTLLFRPVGAVVFGILSDRYGRRWPLVVNLMLLSGFQIGSGFVQTFQQFLALRSLFGICMGGIWGLAAATALENLPVEARGFISGILQQGYAVGYLIAAVIDLELVPKVEAGWRALFWTAAGISGAAAVVRAITPESEFFLRAKAARGSADTKNKTRVFLHETKVMLHRHWMLCIYAVLLMAGFNFLSHGSQDLYPTYLKVTKGFTDDRATVATIIGNVGAVVGGGIAGYASQYIGRRLAILICVLFIGAFIPLWILPDNFSGLAAGAFCLQFGVQGAWGVIPIFLSEISPPAFRGTFPGVAYQIGNMISAASAQIETTGGNNMRTTIIVDGVPTDVPDYAKVQGIFIGVIAAFVFCITLVGPEQHGAHFERAKAAFEEGAGEDQERIEDGREVENTDGVTEIRREKSKDSSVRDSIREAKEKV